MFWFFFKKIFGSKNDREVKRIRQNLVPKINEFEQQFQSLSDDQLRAKTVEFRTRLETGRKERGYHELMAGARRLESDLRGDEAKIERRKAFDIEQAAPQGNPARGVRCR